MTNIYTGPQPRIAVELTDVRNKPMDKKMIKLPKKLNKMSATEQRKYFIEKMNEHYELAEYYKKLSQKKVQVVVPENDVRPDEIAMKDA